MKRSDIKRRPLSNTTLVNLAPVTDAWRRATWRTLGIEG
jgi:hypothetical protein